MYHIINLTEIHVFTFLFFTLIKEYDNGDQTVVKYLIQKKLVYNTC